MKYLCLDYGERNIGVAVSNAEGTIAFPRTTLLKGPRLAAALEELCAKEGIEKLVVGDTRVLSGEPNPITGAAEEFAHTVAKALQLPIEFAREGWSSIEAARFAPKGEEHNDAAAAAVILQRFLDMRQKR